MPQGRSLSEVEFERLPKVVRRKVERDQPAEHANDNGLVWPLLPFPEGWYAASASIARSTAVVRYLPNIPLASP